MTEPGVGPAIARERLRLRLRELRDQSGMSPQQVCKAMSWKSLSKLNRIENGVVTIQPVEAQVLLQVYGVTDAAEIERLKQLAAISRERKWWSKHSLSPEFKEFIAFENEASHLYAYHALLVPGILQTPEYARGSIAQLLRRSPDDKAVEERLEVRLNRQAALMSRLDGANPPALTQALDEAVLMRTVGSTEIMHGQLRHLLELAERPSVTLVIAPLASEGNPALGGNFELLSFAGRGDADVAFIESMVSDTLVTEEEQTRTLREIMDVLVEECDTGPDAIRQIRKIDRSLGR
jgi:transcriptional regulator with XRE-family HTH domain